MVTGFIQHFLIRIQVQFNLSSYIILFLKYKNDRLSLLSDTKLNIMHHCRHLKYIFFNYRYTTEAEYNYISCFQHPNQEMVEERSPYTQIIQLRKK